MRFPKSLRPSPALVVAVIAVVLAWTGGASSATQGGAASTHQARFTVRHAPSPSPGSTLNRVHCESGEVATGGGTYGSIGALSKSAPISTGGRPTGWEALSSRGPLDVYVICERP